MSRTGSHGSPGSRGSPNKKASITFSDTHGANVSQTGALTDLDTSVEPHDTTFNATGTTFHSPGGSGATSPKSGSKGSPKGSPSRSSKDSKEKSSVTGEEKQGDDCYVPTPYTFRAPARAKNFVRMNAKCPPFYLQLDHTLAVIWTLFCDNPPVTLGIAQLQWALNFLQGIYTRKGEHPKDVALCIQAIEDLLLVKYADMAQDVSKIQEEEKRKQLRKMAFALSDTSMKSKQTVCESETCFGRMSMDIDRVLNFEATIESNPLPFSVNYNHMVDKVRLDFDQLYSKHSKASTTVSGVELPQENTMDFLEKWRTDQIRKIQSELLRLQSIETYIGCAETNIDSIKETMPKDDSLRDKPQKFYY